MTGRDEHYQVVWDGRRDGPNRGLLMTEADAPRPAPPEVSRAEFDAQSARIEALEQQIAELTRRLARPAAAPAPRELDRRLVDTMLRAGLHEAFRATAAYAAGNANADLGAAIKALKIRGGHTMGLAMRRLAKTGLAIRLPDDNRGAVWQVAPAAGDSAPDNCHDCHAAGQSEP